MALQTLIGSIRWRAVAVLIAIAAKPSRPAIKLVSRARMTKLANGLGFDPTQFDVTPRARISVK